jgi:molecular chaperone GrpE
VSEGSDVNPDDLDQPETDRTFEEIVVELEDGQVTEDVSDLTPEEIERNALIAERDQFKDIALRLQADFENYRKRITNQQSDEIDRSTGRIAESLLPVLDACEAAFAHGVAGVEPIWSQLMGVLQKQGLEALDLTEKPFNPALADAVLHEEGDADEPVVSEVLRTGYTWKGRVLRAAMVKVRG